MNFPPNDFESLRQLTILLRQGEIDLPIGKKSLLALETMLNDAELVATCNIVELAEKIEFSAASITRLAKLLGFQGFNQLKNLFKQKNKIPTNFYSEKAKKLVSKDRADPKAIFKEFKRQAPLWLDQAPQVPQLAFDALGQVKALHQYSGQQNLAIQQLQQQIAQQQRSSRQRWIALSLVACAALLANPDLNLQQLPWYSWALGGAGLFWLWKKD